MNYLCLNKNIFLWNNFKIIPIRMKDRNMIMSWRNDQIYHLRQKAKLKRKDQDLYFKNIVKKQFKEKQPNQLLFSFIENNLLIGYGGLVHIDWTNKNAEISFLMKTELESERFIELWNIFLKLGQTVEF